AGRKPVLEFLRGLLAAHPADAAQIAEEMEHVRHQGLRAARKLTGELYEVRVDGNRVIYRVLFSVEGEKGRILLAIEASPRRRRSPHRKRSRLRSGGSRTGVAEVSPSNRSTDLDLSLLI